MGFIFIVPRAIGFTHGGGVLTIGAYMRARKFAYRVKLIVNNRSDITEITECNLITVKAFILIQ